MAYFDDYGTLLQFTALSGNAPAFDLTKYSGRGLSQSLEPIVNISGAGSVLGSLIKRGVNADLENMIPKRFRKYASVIACRDGETPCFDNAWLGDVLQVDCVPELSFLTGSPGYPNRPVVSGSLRTQGDFTYYRPQLVMMVTGIKNGFDEYRAEFAWSIDLQEV